MPPSPFGSSFAMWLYILIGIVVVLLIVAGLIYWAFAYLDEEGILRDD